MDESDCHTTWAAWTVELRVASTCDHLDSHVARAWSATGEEWVAGVALSELTEGGGGVFFLCCGEGDVRIVSLALNMGEERVGEGSGISRGFLCAKD